MIGLGSAGPEQALSVSSTALCSPVVHPGEPVGLSEVAELSAKAETQIPPGEPSARALQPPQSRLLGVAQWAGLLCSPATRGGEMARL